jgi:hypothetical protein
MSSTKVKIYKNPERDKAVTHKPYVPQYQIMGVEPAEHKSAALPHSQMHTAQKPYAGSTDNPRDKRPHIRQQPYAEAVPSPIGRGRGPIPNVGNNMEQTWSGVDGEIVDDISESLDPNHPMVDNNEFVSANALGLTDDKPTTMEVGAIDSLRNATLEIEKTFLTENVLQNALQEEYLSKLIKQLNEDEYCILVDGNAICSGPADYIQEQTRSLVFGEHELYNGNPVSVDDILVIKRVKIKVGVFLD